MVVVEGGNVLDDVKGGRIVREGKMSGGNMSDGKCPGANVLHPRVLATQTTGVPETSPLANLC